MRNNIYKSFQEIYLFPLHKYNAQAIQMASYASHGKNLSFFFLSWFFRKLFLLTLHSLFYCINNSQPEDEIIKACNF